MFSELKNLSLFLSILCLLLVTMACSDHTTGRKVIPGISAQKVEIIRFEQLVCSSGDADSATRINNLIKAYPVFTDVFFNQVIFPQNTTSIKLENLLRNFCAAPAIQHLIDTTQILYPALNTLQIKLGNAFGYFHYYFPDRPVPKVFTYVSEFGIGTFTVDTRVLGIGLDFFLGTDYPYYDPAVFPVYLQRTMTSDYMAAKAVRALSQVLISPVTKGNLLDYMIYHGKKLFLASRLLPEEPMYRLSLYTSEQMGWVQNNELNIWSYLLDLGYFYESDQRKFSKFIEPAPTTPGLPEAAPGRVANWIGYRIVESYMNHHPDVSIQQLLNNSDFQSIMDESNYKPERPR